MRCINRQAVACSDSEVYEIEQHKKVSTGIKLKVCGMRDAGNILEISRLAPDFMGFIFYGPSPRFVGDDFHIPDGLSSATKRVGVFVNAPTPAIVKTVTKYQLDLVQLHGNESPGQCSEIRASGVGVIKAFSIDDDIDFKVTKPYEKAADFFLFDTKGKYYGGNAKTFNWEVLSRYDQQVPFFLSGGINSSHIRKIKALKDYNMVAIDVNSGVELRPAYKDLHQVRIIGELLKY